jgi:hypothetical protein
MLGTLDQQNGGPMPRYFAVLTIVLMLGMVLGLRS